MLLNCRIYSKAVMSIYTVDKWHLVTFNWRKNDVNTNCASFDSWDWKCCSLKENNAVQKVDRESITTRCYRPSSGIVGHSRGHTQHRLSPTSVPLITVCTSYSNLGSGFHPGLHSCRDRKKEPPHPKKKRSIKNSFVCFAQNNSSLQCSLSSKRVSTVFSVPIKFLAAFLLGQRHERPPDVFWPCQRQVSLPGILGHSRVW